MNDRLDEHQEALAHQMIMEKLWTQPLLDVTMPELATPDGSTVLVAEARCGLPAISWSRYLPESTRIIALDPSRTMLDQARQRIAEDLQRRIFFVPQSIQSLSYADDVFKASVCVHGLNTPAQLRDGLRELSRVTQHGGQLMVAMPTWDCFAEIFDMFDEALQAQQLTDAAQRLQDCRRGLIHEENVVSAAREFGLHDLSLTRHSWDVAFSSGREVVLSPILRETLFDSWISVIRSSEREPSLRYIADAIDTYFHGRTFESTLKLLSLVASR